MGYDKSATIQRIMDAATREFAEHGLAGARMDRIADRASANKASIYMYFDNKETLFAAVLKQTLRDLAEAVEVGPDRVPEYVGDLFDYQLSHPELLSLVQQEALSFDPAAVPSRESRTAHYDDKVASVRQAQDSNQVDPTLSARNVVLALIGMVSWFSAAPQISQMIVGDIADKKVLARHRAALVEYARRIVAPQA